MLFKIAPYFDKDRTYALRGICMLMIMACHIPLVLGTNSTFFSRYLIGWGYIATGVFFFLSGFGLYMSLTSKKTLPISWLMVKLKKLIFPFIFTFLCYCLLALFLDQTIIKIDLIKQFISFTIPGTTTWFFKVILGLYILTWLVFRTNKSNAQKVAIICICSFIYFITARHILNLEGFWSKSVLNFPLGMIFGLLHKRIIPSPKFEMLYLFLAFLVYIYAKFKFEPWITSLCFSLLCIQLASLVNIDNTFLRYIGKESINFYLFQMIFLHFISIYTQSWIVFVPIYFSLTILLSWSYTLLDKKINI